MGYLLSAFLWAYAFSQLPTGAMVDRLGPRLLLTSGLSLWSLAQVLGGLVHELRRVLRRPRAARRRRGAAISDLRARGAGLVQSARPRARDRHLQLRLVAGHRDRRAAADLPDADFRLAHDVHDHGRRRASSWRRSGICVYRNPTEVALTRGGERLSHPGRSAGPAHQGDAARMEAAVPLPHHLGHDPRLFRLHLSDLDLHRLAARLSRDRAAHERQIYRRGAAAIPFAWGVVGGVLGGYHRRHPGAPRRLAGRRAGRYPGRDRVARHRGLHRRGGLSSPATRSRSPSSRPRCSWSMSPAPAPGR